MIQYTEHPVLYSGGFSVRTLGLGTDIQHRRGQQSKTTSVNIIPSVVTLCSLATFPTKLLIIETIKWPWPKCKSHLNVSNEYPDVCIERLRGSVSGSEGCREGCRPIDCIEASLKFINYLMSVRNVLASSRTGLFAVQTEHIHH